MVVPIRDLGNITSNTLTICESILNMKANDDVEMEVNLFDQLFQSTCNKCDEVWDCFLAQSAHSPKTSSISWSKYEESYAEWLEKLNNRMDEDEPVITSNYEPSISLQLRLEYMTPKSQTGHVGKVANSSNIACQ